MRPPTKTTCLLVDDHPLICHGMRLLLETDHRLSVVGEASSGELALDLLRNLRPDVALVDATLRTAFDGFQTTAQARAERLPTRVVIYSAHKSAEYARRALHSGAFGYVNKMSSYDVVLDSLRAVASGDRYVDPAVAVELISATGPILSTRERDVLNLLACGMQNGGIAFDLGISGETVKTHIAHLFAKFDVQTRAGAVAEGFRAGLLS